MRTLSDRFMGIWCEKKKVFVCVCECVCCFVSPNFFFLQKFAFLRTIPMPVQEMYIYTHGVMIQTDTHTTSKNPTGFKINKYPKWFVVMKQAMYDNDPTLPNNMQTNSVVIF